MPTQHNIVLVFCTSEKPRRLLKILNKNTINAKSNFFVFYPDETIQKLNCCAFEWNLFSWEYTVRRLNNRRSVCKENPQNWRVQIWEKYHRRKSANLVFTTTPSLSLRGGNISQISFSDWKMLRFFKAMKLNCLSLTW
jgi:hypothetical protein